MRWHPAGATIIPVNTMPTDQWIFVLDHRAGRLVRGRIAAGRAHLDEVARLTNDEPEHVHERPSSLSGRSSHGYASLHHEEEERRHRFAKTAAAWLAPQVQQQHIARLTVVAPGHLLGALRKTWPARLAALITEREAELSALTPAELAQHPAIAQILRAPGNA